MIFESNHGESFSQEELIDFMDALTETDSNSEKKWTGL